MLFLLQILVLNKRPSRTAQFAISWYAKQVPEWCDYHLNRGFNSSSRTTTICSK